MSNIVNKIKSRSPIVKKKSHDILINELEFYKKHSLELEERNNNWTKEVRGLRLEIQRIKEYDQWLLLNYPNEKELDCQRIESQQFKFRPLISIIMPVYNTDPDYLRVCINSVISQSYENWEFCIRDDASSKKSTLQVLREYSDNSKIKITRSEINRHISVASNEAIDMAEGEFIALLDHDDFLWPNALYETVKLLQEHSDADLIYSDQDKINASPRSPLHLEPYFKPDWSPHLLENVNYITHFCVLRSNLVRKIGGFNKHLVGAQDWDLFLRVTENSNKIFHIPTILYSWRAHQNSTALSTESKSYTVKNQIKTLKQHFNRINVNNFLIKFNKNYSGLYLINYIPKKEHKVSIVIPTKDKKDYLERCLSSIINKTTYANYEIVIVDTGSTEKETLEYYEHLKVAHSKKMHIIHWKHSSFNYSEACNYGAKKAKGGYYLMLNNDTEVISSDWIQDMLGFAEQENIGAVGVKLLYPNNQIQHAGVATGIGSLDPVASHPGITIDEDSGDPLAILYIDTTRDVSAVTAACMMISRDKFWKVKGFDPKFRVTFNDVDLNLKLMNEGLTNIYLPFVLLYHHESISVGRVQEGKRDLKELQSATSLMIKKWKTNTAEDKYYNKNFYKLSSNFGLDIYSKQ